MQENDVYASNKILEVGRMPIYNHEVVKLLRYAADQNYYICFNIVTAYFKEESHSQRTVKRIAEMNTRSRTSTSESLSAELVPGVEAPDETAGRVGVLMGSNGPAVGEEGKDRKVPCRRFTSAGRAKHVIQQLCRSLSNAMNKRRF